MAKGAKQKSNVILLASGSKHARPNEPRMKTPLGPAPVYFSGVALETWKMFVAELTAAGTIFQVDRVGLETLCLAVQRQREAQEMIDQLGVIFEDPVKGWTKNPACTVIVAENNTIARYLAEYGLTPASRGKVAAPTHAKKSRFADL
jgi:P27 family predicted phage terminase small subunit